MTISQLINYVKNNGSGVHTVTGIIVRVNDQFALIQDDTGALPIRYTAGAENMYPELALGNEVSFDAMLEDYFDTIIVQRNTLLDNLTVISSDNVVDPLVVTEMYEFEQAEQRLIQFQGIVEEVIVDNFYPYVKVTNENMSVYAYTQGSILTDIRDLINSSKTGGPATIIGAVQPRTNISKESILIYAIEDITIIKPKFRKTGDVYFNTESVGNVKGYKFTKQSEIDKMISGEIEPDTNYLYFSDVTDFSEIEEDVEQVNQQVNQLENTLNYIAYQLPVLVGAKEPYEYETGVFQVYGYNEPITNDTSVILQGSEYPYKELTATATLDVNGFMVIKDIEKIVDPENFEGQYIIYSTDMQTEYGAGHLRTFWVSGDALTQGSIMYIPQSDPIMQRSAVNILINDVLSNEDLLKNTDVIDNTYSTETDKPLSANQGKLLNENKVDKTDIVDNLLSTSTTAPLSANMGKVLNDLIGDINTILDEINGEVL